MAVVGIDLGNLNIVIAQAQRGGVDVILNENSNRQNPNMVSIAEKQRYVGEQAVTLARSNYKNTIYATKRLIGKKYDEPDVQQEIQSLPFKVIKLPKGGVGYEVSYGGEPTVLSPEQVVAMLFGKVNEIVKNNNNGTPIAEAVVAIPGWFTDSQRRAVLDAAEISGLNVLRLMHESTAVALSYGIYKSVRSLFHESEPQHVLFLDLGHSNFCASVVAFIQGKLIVKSAVYDRSLGGRDFDKQIVDFMAEQFQAKYKLGDPRENAKAMLKLQAAAEKAKKTLSPAGVSEASISVECVMEDTDLNTALSLEEFERRVQPLLARLEAPITQALAEAGVTPEQLANVEVVGGGTRVNSVKMHIAGLLHLDKTKLNYGLSTTLNADEAVSRGCALQAAILSSRFQVKPFEVLEACPYPINLSWEESPSAAAPMDEDEPAAGGEGEEAAVKAGDGSVLLFKRNDKVPNQRRVTFRKDADFTVTATYDESALPLLPPGTSTDIASFQVALPKEHQGLGDKSKVRLTLVYNLHGVLVMNQAQLMEEVTAPPTATNTPETGKVEAEGDKAAEAAGEGVAADGAPAAEGAAGAPEEEKKEEKPAQAEPATPAAAATKKKFKTHSLSVVTVAPGLSKVEKDAFVEVEAQMEQQDRIIRETADTRNALESYIYDLKAKLGDKLKPYAEESAAAAFNTQLEDMEAWLYGDEGFDSTKSVYAGKLATLRSVGDPIQQRSDEASKREPARVEFCRQLEEYKTLVKSTDEKYSHITDEERNKVREEVTAAESWLYDQLAKQTELPSYADPVLTVAAIKERQNAVAHAVLPVMNRPKPPPPARTPTPAADEKAATPQPEGDGAETPAAEKGATEATPMDEGAAPTPEEGEEEPMDTAS
eukprot:evm.model.NODE_19466_length_64249_cov_18.424255.11